MGSKNHTVLRLPKHCVLFLAIMPKQSLIKMEQEDDDCNSEEFDIDNQIQELDQELLLAFDDKMEAPPVTAAAATAGKGDGAKRPKPLTDPDVMCFTAS